MTLRFDESQLRTQLDRLSREHRAAFAAACAERLFPAYMRFSQEARTGDLRTRAPPLVTSRLRASSAILRQNARMRAFEARPAPLSRETDGAIRVSGTRVSLESVVSAFDAGATAEEIVQQYPSLELSATYAIISCHETTCPVQRSRSSQLVVLSSWL